MRGPAVLPRHPGHRPPRPLADRHHFDRLVLEAIADIEDRWSDRLGLVEYAVEDAPRIPDDWSDASVPLSSLVRGSTSTPTRLVVFRRPLELRAADRADPEQPYIDGFQSSPSFLNMSLMPRSACRVRASFSISAKRTWPSP